MKLSVALLPAHAVDGSESMWRYWHEVRDGLARTGGDVFEAREAFLPAGGPRRAGWLRRLWCKRFVYRWRVARMRPADVYHLLDHGFAHVLEWLPRGVTVVATIHDLAPVVGDEGLTRAQLQRFRQSVENLRRAARLVVPSRFVAAQVRTVLGISGEKISVVPMGVDPVRFAPRLSAAPSDYVLSVGSCLPRKNLEMLPAILRATSPNVPGIRLRRAGDALPGKLRAELAVALSGRLEELGRVDDATLAELYRGALALVVPSRLEGFGLPVLEGMAAGCPVVCSNAASLPEAGGDAALYFAPDDAATAAQHLSMLATQPAFRAAVIDRGLARARQFSWDAHVAGLISIYRQAASV